MFIYHIFSFKVLRNSIYFVVKNYFQFLHYVRLFNWFLEYSYKTLNTKIPFCVNENFPNFCSHF